MLTPEQFTHDLLALGILFDVEPLAPVRMTLYWDVLRPTFEDDEDLWKAVCLELMQSFAGTSAERFPVPARFLDLARSLAEVRREEQRKRLQSPPESVEERQRQTLAREEADRDRTVQQWIRERDFRQRVQAERQAVEGTQTGTAHRDAHEGTQAASRACRADMHDTDYWVQTGRWDRNNLSIPVHDPATRKTELLRQAVQVRMQEVAAQEYPPPAPVTRRGATAGDTGREKA